MSRVTPDPERGRAAGAKLKAPASRAAAQAAIVEWDRDVFRERLPAVRRLHARACMRSSSELHQLVEHTRLSAACPGFLALAVLDEEDEPLAFGYGRRSEGDTWWWQAPLVKELRRKRKPRRWLRDAYVIGELAVAPDAQGRGLGRALVEHLLANKEAAGATAVVIVSEASAGTAAEFYRTLGFADLLSECRFRPETSAKRVMVLAEDLALTAHRARGAAPTRSSRARRSGA